MFQLTHKPNLDGAKLALSGSLTIYEAREAHALMIQALARLQGTDWQVDLAELDELDSAGAQLLLALQRQADERGAQLRIRNPAPAVLELLQLLRLHTLYPDAPPVPRPGA